MTPSGGFLPPHPNYLSEWKWKRFHAESQLAADNARFMHKKGMYSRIIGAVYDVEGMYGLPCFLVVKPFGSSEKQKTCYQCPYTLCLYGTVKLLFAAMCVTLDVHPYTCPNEDCGAVFHTATLVKQHCARSTGACNKEKEGKILNQYTRHHMCYHPFFPLTHILLHACINDHQELL